MAGRRAVVGTASVGLGKGTSAPFASSEDPRVTTETTIGTPSGGASNASLSQRSGPSRTISAPAPKAAPKAGATSAENWNSPGTAPPPGPARSWRALLRVDGEAPRHRRMEPRIGLAASLLPGEDEREERGGAPALRQLGTAVAQQADPEPTPPEFRQDAERVVPRLAEAGMTAPVMRERDGELDG